MLQLQYVDSQIYAPSQVAQFVRYRLDTPVIEHGQGGEVVLAGERGAGHVDDTVAGHLEDEVTADKYVLGGEETAADVHRGGDVDDRGKHGPAVLAETQVGVQVCTWQVLGQVHRRVALQLQETGVVPTQLVNVDDTL